jgi:hypothetical protein
MSDGPRFGTVKASDIAAHPTMRMDAEYWLNRSEIERPVIVRCEDCGFTDDAEKMIREEDGAWLCGPCRRGENE